jgi:predicted small lipoprotein YifL
MSRSLFTTIAIRIAMVAVVAVLLAGCGKKGNPQPPPGEPSTYPKQYPSS